MYINETVYEICCLLEEAARRHESAAYNAEDGSKPSERRAQNSLAQFLCELSILLTLRDEAAAEYGVHDTNHASYEWVVKALVVLDPRLARDINEYLQQTEAK